MFKPKLIATVLIIIIAAGFIDCFANSEVKVSSNVDKTEISLDEPLQFKITIEGINQSFGNPQIKLPQLDSDFNVVATSQSNNINFNAGQMQMAWQMNYTLLPKREGSLKINSTEIIYEGKSYKTQEIMIMVKPPKNPQQNIPQKQTPQTKNVPWSENEGISI